MGLRRSRQHGRPTVPRRFPGETKPRTRELEGTRLQCRGLIERRDGGDVNPEATRKETPLTFPQQDPRFFGPHQVEVQLCVRV